ncbi:MAG TPA: 4'-phosphopantetheinyl transferase superfamily protein [Acidimicrobiales bacterium]|nr:4'-phosphopantetheinyl transferase superfamily protein [Acidimicrobiales bacterium]
MRLAVYRAADAGSGSSGEGDLPAIGRGVVGVWKIWIGGEPDLERARAVLSADELDRASSFVFDLHRNRYLARRVALRELLGRYLDRAPSDVCFSYSAYGKPELPGETLRFNVAHSEDLALIGLTEQDRLGVDVAHIRELPDMEGVARTVFSKHELDVFHTLPASSKTEGFFNCWTRKEAFVKAVGDGLSYPLDVFDVTLRPGEEARLLEVEGSRARAAGWSLFDVAPMDGWVGAAAVENAAAALHGAGWLGARAEPG